MSICMNGSDGQSEKEAFMSSHRDRRARRVSSVSKLELAQQINSVGVWLFQSRSDKVPQQSHMGLAVDNIFQAWFVAYKKGRETSSRKLKDQNTWLPSTAEAKKTPSLSVIQLYLWAWWDLRRKGRCGEGIVNNRSSCTMRRKLWESPCSVWPCRSTPPALEPGEVDESGWSGWWGGPLHLDPAPGAVFLDCPALETGYCLLLQGWQFQMFWTV